MDESALATGGGLSLGTLLLVKAFDFLRQRRSLRAAEGGATALIEGLTQRVQQLEAKVVAMDARLAQEIKARITAQEAAATMRVHILLLEEVLRDNGIPVPSTFQDAYKQLFPATQAVGPVPHAGG